MASNELEEVCENLDKLAIRYLDVLEGILDQRALLDNLMKDAFVNMAKARYSMGNNAVSGLQLPSEEAEIQALEICEENTVKEELHNYVEFKMNSNANENCKSDEKSLRHRKKALDKENSKGETNDNKLEAKKKDPLKWFGILVPSSLKDCQRGFKQTLPILCKLATLQNELVSIGKEYDVLKERKKKLIH